MSSALEVTLAVAIHLLDTEHLPEEVREGQEESNIMTPHGRVIQILLSEEGSGKVDLKRSFVNIQMAYRPSFWPSIKSLRQTLDERAGGLSH